MANELVVKGKLPEAVELKFQGLMEQANHASKKRSLTAVRNALADLFAKGDTEFKYADVGKLSHASYDGPKAGTISNSTSVHLQALIQVARENVTKQNKSKRNLSDEDKLLKEIMPFVQSAQSRKQLQMLLHELKATRNQLNILKGDYLKNKPPIQFSVPATGGPLPSADGQNLEALNVAHIKAIKTFLGKIGGKVGGSGLYKNEYGALEDVNGDEVAPVGFYEALKKILEIYDGSD